MYELNDRAVEDILDLLDSDSFKLYEPDGKIKQRYLKGDYFFVPRELQESLERILERNQVPYRKTAGFEWTEVVAQYGEGVAVIESVADASG